MENELSRVVDALPGLVWTALPDGRSDFINRRWSEYTGLGPDEALGLGWRSAIHPDDVDDWLAGWNAMLISGDGGELDARLRRHDGEHRWFRFSISPIADASGRLVGWCGVNTDIEDHRRTADVDDAGRAEALLAGEKQLLDMVAGGRPMPEILEALCRLAETTASGCRCCVALVDSTGACFEDGAAPSLPRGFIGAIRGLALSDDSGPCAKAARINEKVVAPDMGAEPAWAAQAWFRIALEQGLRSCVATPIRSAAGKVLGAFGIYFDASSSPAPQHQALIDQFTSIARIAVERAQNLEALKLSEARKAAILDSALDGIVTIDHQGLITEFNPAAERMFGYRRDAVLGLPLAEAIVPPSLREQHRMGFARYLATGEARAVGRRLEMMAMRAGGGEFPVEIAITRIALDGPPSFTAYLRDITERRRAEEELRRSNAYLAEAQRLSLTGSFIWNVTEDRHYWSDELYRIFGYDLSTAPTLQVILQNIHADDMPLIDQVIADATAGRDFELECRVVLPGASVKHIHVVAHRMPGQDDRLEYIGAVQDITERHLSEEALNRARSELAHVARVTSLGALTASIAHEVNQPLAGIITNASTCLKMLGADPPNVAGALETARRTIRDGNRAADVIRRLRALFSKTSGGAEAVDLNEAAREVIALSWGGLQRSQVILQTQFAEDLPFVAGDRVQLQQVILNLLLNASDAMGEVSDRPRRIEIWTEPHDADQVRLSVRDAGAGFDPQEANRLFDAFYTTKSGGMGIGLSVSRSIIESHHGRLRAEPNDGPGATFSFTLPRMAEPAAGRVSHRHAPADTAAGRLMESP